MSMENVPGTDLKYYLISFDADGRERADDPDGVMSERVLEALRQDPITYIFIISHGWKGDLPAAREQYRNWIAAMARNEADRERVRQLRHNYWSLLVGLHWPSLPFGDEELGAGGVSFGVKPAGARPAAAPEAASTEVLINAYASRIADTAKAREALKTIFAAAAKNVAPNTLPQEVRQAYEILNEEAGLQSGGAAAAPGADREPFDPEAYYQAVRRDEAMDFSN